MKAPEPIALLGIACVVMPGLLFAFLGLSALFGHKLRERTVIRLCQACVWSGLALAVAMLGFMLIDGRRNVPIDLGSLVDLPAQHFHLTWKLVFDRLSIPFVILSYLLCGTVSAFAGSYLHRERGFNRFFTLFAMFTFGMVLTSVAGTIETLFAGWETVGLSSALLVAFFHERTAPVQNGLRVWSVYRVTDAAFLVAAVYLHHQTGEGDFGQMMGSTPWPFGQTALKPGQVLVIGWLLMIAVAGKSALVPFSGWLPRAMEGPTPSSAVFYGALSVHLGAFLLLRISPLLDASAVLSAIVFVWGLTTAIYAALVTRVQTDIKSSLAYASLTQVGLIVAEIGLGFRYVALVHIIGHACLRTLQLLRAPSLLRDFHALENAIGSGLPHGAREPKGVLARWSAPLYRFSLERGYFDLILDRYVAGPVLRAFKFCDARERKFAESVARSDERAQQAGELSESVRR